MCEAEIATSFHFISYFLSELINAKPYNEAAEKKQN